MEYSIIFQNHHQIKHCNEAFLVFDMCCNGNESLVYCVLKSVETHQWYLLKINTKSGETRLKYYNKKITLIGFHEKTNDILLRNDVYDILRIPVEFPELETNHRTNVVKLFESNPIIIFLDSRPNVTTEAGNGSSYFFVNETCDLWYSQFDSVSSLIWKTPRRKIFTDAFHQSSSFHFQLQWNHNRTCIFLLASSKFALTSSYLFLIHLATSRYVEIQLADFLTRNDPHPNSKLEVFCDARGALILVRQSLVRENSACVWHCQNTSIEMEAQLKNSQHNILSCQWTFIASLSNRYQFLKMSQFQSNSIVAASVTPQGQLLIETKSFVLNDENSLFGGKFIWMTDRTRRSLGFVFRLGRLLASSVKDDRQFRLKILMMLICRHTSNSIVLSDFLLSRAIEYSLQKYTMPIHKSNFF